jgi:uncharacterized membrane protein YeaQ/YmgE (transglycosylase-associated protein family)
MTHATHWLAHRYPAGVAGGAGDHGHSSPFECGWRHSCFSKLKLSDHTRENLMGIIWTIIIGFVAGIIAKFIMPGSNEPSGFILTTILGIVGAFVATFLGQAIGWYNAGEGAGLIGAVVGAVIVLALYGMVANKQTQP